MMVKEIMSTDVQAIEAGTPIKQAAAMMKTLDVGFLPIALSNKLAGAITDRDIVVRGVAEGLDLQKTTVEQIMTQQPAVVFEDATVEEAATAMKDKQIRRLLVQSSEGGIVGVVSIGDLATELEDDELAGQTLEKVSASAS
jgi:CBS domain-containing protein